MCCQTPVFLLNCAHIIPLNTSPISVPDRTAPPPCAPPPSAVSLLLPIQRHAGPVYVELVPEREKLDTVGDRVGRHALDSNEGSLSFFFSRPLTHKVYSKVESRKWGEEYTLKVEDNQWRSTRDEYATKGAVLVELHERLLKTRAL